LRLSEGRLSGLPKNQVTTEVNGVEWLRKGPLSIEYEMGVGHILADQGKNGVMAQFFEVPLPDRCSEERRVYPISHCTIDRKIIKHDQS